MKLTNRKVISAIALSAMMLGIAGSGQVLAGTQYGGTAYVAGMGGHFARTVFKIDPSAETPITIEKLDKVDIGTGATHPTHDARIDNQDRNTMYWSTYKPDAQANNSYHYGKSDLKTGQVIKDATMKVPDKVINTKAGYCASAQTPDYFMPISMNKPGYLSVISKKDMQVKHNVFFEGTDADIKTGYKYMHGINSPDMKEILLTVNEANTTQDNKELGDTVGKMHMIVLDAAALEQGQVKVLRKATADGNQKSTISFRQYYSPDGKYIANATGDILYLIDAKTLQVLDAETMPKLQETHDAIFTPDGRYVIATSRTKSILPDCANPQAPADGEWRMDGQLKLYDVEARKFIGKPVSACLACHDDELGTGPDAPHAVLCGLDVNWQ
ncbi:MAG: hypothetical protein AB1461_08715 [Thermodesulfobacteriota bacterium]